MKHQTVSDGSSTSSHKSKIGSAVSCTGHSAYWNLSKTRSFEIHLRGQALSAECRIGVCKPGMFVLGPSGQWSDQMTRGNQGVQAEWKSLYYFIFAVGIWHSWFSMVLVKEPQELFAHAEWSGRCQYASNTTLLEMRGCKPLREQITHARWQENQENTECKCFLPFVVDHFRIWC